MILLNEKIILSFLHILISFSKYCTILKISDMSNLSELLRKKYRNLKCLPKYCKRNPEKLYVCGIIPELIMCLELLNSRPLFAALSSYSAIGPHFLSEDLLAQNLLKDKK